MSDAPGQAEPPATGPPGSAPRRPRRRFDRIVLGMIWKTVAITLMASGLLLVTVRLTLPGISSYRAEIERWMSEALGIPVTIGTLHADWSGWSPELRIEDVRLVQRVDGETVARFEQAHLTLDPIASLKRGELRTGDITLTGASFVITRQRDGVITFANDEQRPAAGDEGMAAGSMVPWLMRHQRIRLRNTDIVWHDLRTGGEPLVFEDVEVAARNDGERHQFEGTVRLPDRLGERLSFALDATGNLMTPAWSGDVFLRGERIRPETWGFLEEPLGVSISGGESGFEVWTTWTNARLQRAEGRLQLADTVFRGGHGALEVDDASANVSVWRGEHGWDVDIADLDLATAAGAWPKTSIALSYAEADAERAARITGRVGFLRLRDLLPLVGAHLPVDPGLFDGDRMDATLRDLAFAFTPGDGALGDLQLDMHVDALRIAARDGMPGVSSLSGTLEVAGNRGQLELDGDGFVLDLGDRLPMPIDFRQASGRLTWASAASGWQLDADGLQLANGDVAARLRGGLRFREGDPSPFMRIVVQVQRGRLGALGAFLPRDLLPEDVRTWLETALPVGSVRGGEVLLHGLLDDFPFDAGSGRLQARLEVAGARLDYQPGWPALNDLHGFVVFDGRRLEVAVDDGEVQDSRIVHARAVVEDLGSPRPLLEVTGRATGTTEQAAGFLGASPLGGEFADAMTAVALAGPSELDLDLRIPLVGHGTEVRGSLRLVGNTVRVHGLARGLEALSGRIDFTADSITSHSLEALYLGRPVGIDLSRRGDDRSTRVGLRGRADRELLLAHFANVGLPLESGSGAGLLLDHTTGESDFVAALELPDDWSDPAARARLEAQSTLAGVAISLPAPLGKTAAETRLLRIASTIGSDGGRLVGFSLDDAVGGSFEIVAGDGGPRLARGALLFGLADDRLPGAEALPAGDTVRIAGRLRELSTSDWYAAIESAGLDEAPPSAAALLDRIAEIDVEVADLRVLDYRLADVGLSGRRDADGHWGLTFAGADIAGSATVPGGGRRRPVRIDLAHLVLRPDPAPAPAATGIGTGYDPRGLPGVVFRARSLRHGDLDLGRVALDTKPVDNGVDVTRLDVANAAFTAEGSGQWLFDPGSQAGRSRFQVALRAPELGSLLGAFGYAEGSTEGGPTDVTIDAHWDGAPSEFALARMRGRLAVTAGPGRLLEVSPGAAGRVFGLLSLGSLPRRLRLDFGDLFGDGFGFERIEGSFALDGGNAYTNDLAIDGSAARIDIAGRTGLVTRDYDQMVTVTPRLSSSLPLAGAVLGPAGAGVGAVIWLAEKLFQRSLVDQVAAYQYTITGPWEEPLVESVAPPPHESSSPLDERG